MMDTDLLRTLSSPWGLALIGLCVGSFVNVVVRRLPLILERRWRADAADLLGLSDSPSLTESISLSHPPSHCPACGRQLRWHELIPLWSWISLKGRCATCGAPIGVRLPLVEAGTMALFCMMGWRWAFEPIALLWGAWGATLVALALIDWDTLLLPDDLTLPLLWVGLCVAALGWSIPPTEAIAGAAWGWGSLWLVGTVFHRVTRREGMGGGDLKLLAALGAWLGPLMLVPLVLIASLSGALVGWWMAREDRLREGRFVPFGPFLAIAALVVGLASPSRWAQWLGWS